MRRSDNTPRGSARADNYGHGSTIEAAIEHLAERLDMIRCPCCEGECEHEAGHCATCDASGWVVPGPDGDDFRCRYHPERYVQPTIDPLEVP